ncbi:hypothetical protein V8D89_001237 [Ganoderma adspersum]
MEFGTWFDGIYSIRTRMDNADQKHQDQVREIEELLRGQDVILEETDDIDV